MVKIDLRRRLLLKRWRKWLKPALIAALALLFGSWFVHLTLILHLNSSKPVDAFFVLGGSIRREIYVAQLAKRYPNIPILISQGSKDPCILLIFGREEARLEKVWLEKCADSTFGNFFFGVPILHRLGVHKVELITSNTHLPRAQWLSQILLGARGIWVDLEIVEEQGVPGNHESTIKTALDVTRSLLWAPFSQIISPPCWSITKLENVNLKKWREKGFECERQGGVV